MMNCVLQNVIHDLVGLFIPAITITDIDVENEHQFRRHEFSSVSDTSG
jgi:hypothetical protein